MHILVTGAAGFIGAAVSQRLLDEGHTVAGVDSFVPYYNLALKEARWNALAKRAGFTGLQLDLSQPMSIAEMVKAGPYDAVMHLAAQAGVRYARDEPLHYIDANVKSTTLIFEMVRRHFPQAKVAYASSSSVYGRNTKQPFHEEDPVNSPASHYAATKRSCELIADTYTHLYDLNLVGLRFFTVYGPAGRPDMAVWMFSQSILAGKPITMYKLPDGGDLKRDFTYIDDIVGGIMAVLGLPGEPRHRVYNLGNSTPVAVPDMIALLETALGRKAIIETVTAGGDEVPATYADVSRAAEELGYAPRVSLVEGLSRWAHWFLSEGKYYGPLGTMARVEDEPEEALEGAAVVSDAA